MAFLISATSVTAPKGLWEWLLGLFSFIPDYAWRIIIFTMLLKLILSPLDFFQKYKMKKNREISELIKPDIEKLQKQYANDKATLQQKQMQLQRAAGFSYFSACLPMLLTLIIFISFFAGMRNISRYEEFKQYVELYDHYSTEYTQLTGLSFIEGKKESESSAEFHQIIIERLEDAVDEDSVAAYQMFLSSGESFSAMHEEYERLSVEREFLKELFAIPKIKETIIKENPSQAEKDKLISDINAELAKLSEIPSTVPSVFISYAQVQQNYGKLSEFDQTEKSVNIIKNIAENVSAAAVKEYYKEHNSSFLWIKSIWIPDVPWADAVVNYSDFTSHVGSYMTSNAVELPDPIYNGLKNKDKYNAIMGEILADGDMRKTNGWMILAILAVGLSLFSQFIMTRQQRESGQIAAAAGGTMKMMLFVMPLMIGVFAITSTSAFSLYMITNSLMTLLINLLTTGITGIMGRGEKRKRVTDEGIIRYGRRDPNDLIDKKE